ncbi:DNA damage-regulated autophagy modulator protein 1 [Intoshia linei]|uniref:DNA damage-regulated autophagy modulator protein 1 n=1 Tax=Intoshia linei TaxID=1819745 RepID=A0A177B6P2_9BILA|nr:DNA damage-regulated autophagy modulator protein 1 [Intoshia linei]
MQLLGYHLVPLSLVVIYPITFLTTYVLSRYYKHTPALPYISDTGVETPESCIFTFALSVAGSCLYIYINYKIIKSTLKSLKIINKIAAALGLTSSIGLVVVGSFQVSNVILCHVIGAAMTFLGGPIYMLIITYLYHSTNKSHNVNIHSKGLMAFRIALSSLMTCVLIWGFIATKQAWEYFDGDTMYSPFMWKETSNGIKWHTASVILEWITFIIYVCYIASTIPLYYNVDSLKTTMVMKHQLDYKSQNAQKSQIKDNVHINIDADFANYENISQNKDLYSSEK